MRFVIHSVELDQTGTQNAWGALRSTEHSADSMLQPICRSFNSCFRATGDLVNGGGLTIPEARSRLTQFVDATSRPIQIRQKDRDVGEMLLKRIEREIEATLNMLAQLFCDRNAISTHVYRHHAKG